MKFLVFLSVAVACVVADVSHLPQLAPIVAYNSEVRPDGYQYNYETGNGIYAQEKGDLKNANGEYPSIAVSGGYKYQSPEGPIEVTYVADENGFQPQGNHLPVGPPIPESVVRALEYIRTHAKPINQS